MFWWQSLDVKGHRFGMDLQNLHLMRDLVGAIAKLIWPRDRCEDSLLWIGNH